METEEQQLEELKRWWKENGRTVIVGLVLGLGGVTGYTAWRAHLNAQAEAASTLYERLVNTAALPNHSGAVGEADNLIAQHPDSSYAALAALVGARSAYKAEDAATAKRLLQWAVERAPALEIQNVARIRLAKLLSEEGDHDAALAQLAAVANAEFKSLAEEARGDVLYAKGDVAAARSAYESLLADEALDASARTRVQVKLDDLAAAGS